MNIFRKTIHRIWYYVQQQKKQKKREGEIMNDKAEPLKRNNLTRNNLFIEERSQITPHKPKYSETKKYSL